MTVSRFLGNAKKQPTPRMTFTRFCKEELRLRLTLGQRVLALIAFDGLEPKDLTGREREVARKIFGDVEEIPPLARRVLALLLGRESGKTLLSAAFGVYTMATADVSECGPGDLPSVVVIAPSKKLGHLAVRAGLEFCRRSPRLKKRIEKETLDGFLLRRRDGRLVAFEAYAASRGGAAARGVTILCAILDEAEFFMSDEAGAFAVNDRDIYSAVAPRSRFVIFMSTPWPVPTLMSEIVEQNWQAPTTALAAKAPTLTMRDNDPRLAQVVESERLRDPINAAREFDADDQVAHGSNIFFDGLAITASVDMKRPMIITAPAGAITYGGGDLALSHDPSTVAAIAASGGQASVLEMAEYRPLRGTPLKLSEVIASFATTLKRHGCNSIMLDGWSREAAREHADKEHLRIDHAPEGRTGKQNAFLSLRKALTESRLTLPNHPRLIAQLRSVTSRPAPGGTLLINSPRRAGSHGDLVSALVLAVWSWGSHPASRFENPRPVMMANQGSDFSTIIAPYAITGTHAGARMSVDQIAESELRKYATANSDPERDAQAAFGNDGTSNRNPFGDF